MKNSLLITLIFTVITAPSGYSQASLKGSWELTTYNGQTLNNERVMLIGSKGYFAYGHYTANGNFVNAGGGNYTMKDGTLKIIYDFHTENPSLIRNPVNYSYKLEGNKLHLTGENTNMTLKQVDQSNTPLTGAWHFSTRLNEDGEPGERRGDGPRQTIKILSGKHFQWAAFNYETKEFYGTGGGTYKAQNGQYTEKIKFFSRDDSRVGASLKFNFKINGKDWYHTGKTSSGDDMGEVWRKKD